MVDMYVVLILNNRRNIDQVPAEWREVVREDLTAIGVDGDGHPIVEE